MATVVFVEKERCTGCGRCVEACPHSALYLEGGIAHVMISRCVGCELCLEACPNGALYAVREPTAPAQAPKDPLPSDEVGRALQPAPSWVAGLGAVVLVAERLLPALVNLVGALRARSSHASLGQQPDALVGGMWVKQGHGRHRVRKRGGLPK